MFVNTLCIRSFPKGEKRFVDYVKEMSEKTIAAFENQDVPFEDLLQGLAVSRDASRNPLFDVMFVLQNMDFPALEVDGIKIRPVACPGQTAKVDLTLVAEEVAGGVQFLLEYSTRLFSRGAIDRFAEYYRNILKGMAADPDRCLADIDIMSAGEKARLLSNFSGLQAAFPAAQTLVELFTKQVEKNPDRIAIVGPGPISLSYSELDGKAADLAGELIGQGVLPNTIVALQVGRSIDMIIGLLGILKAGGAYLPIDPETPGERVQYMLTDSGAEIVIGQHGVGANCCSPIQDIGAECRGERRFAPTDLAYVIYTSGSTGRPKGVAISHRNLCPLLYWGYDHLALTVDDRTIQNLSYFFDWSAWEIFITLTSGASLHLINREILLNPPLMVAFIQGHEITVLHCTPSQFQYLLNETPSLGSLGHLCLGAEKLDVDLLKRSLGAVRPDCRVYNMYGPTEATIMAAVLEIDREAVEDYANLTGVPIGRFVGNTVLRVLDRYLKLCPVKVAGELYIGGAGLARGYLNNPELTAEKFVGGLYKTGDLCRWLEDGTIEFLGRSDFQVKIRGFRIELAEIESQLLKHPDVNEAVVLARDGDNKEKYLCAYLVATDGQTGDTQGLREFLSRALPVYMIPAYFIFLDRMPLNPNGKVDRKALPEPEIGINNAYLPPENSTEEALIDLWSSILEIEKNKISTDRSFFELGGHSLKASVLVARIKKRFSVDVPLADIFKTPILKEMARLIGQAKTHTGLEIEPVEEREYYDLSYNQKRLWYLQQLDPDSTAFLLPGWIALAGDVDAKTVKWALEKLAMRHESFRTGFTVMNHEAVQFILKEINLELETIDLDHLPVKEQRARREESWQEISLKPFDLGRPPLFRAVLVRFSPDRAELQYNLHHIIADGWSLGVLKRDLLRLLKAGEPGKEAGLDPLEVQYRDYAAWQNRLIRDGARRQEALGYWRDRLNGDAWQLELPVDFTGRGKDRRGAGFRCPLNGDLPAGLKALSRQCRTSLLGVMLSAYLWMLYRYSGRMEVGCSVISAGRDNVLLHGLMGFFVNSLLFKTAVVEEESFSNFVGRVHQEVMEGLHYQSYPVELVFKEMGVRYPEVGVSFNMVNLGDIGPSQAGAAAKPGHIQDVQEVKFDIELYVHDENHGLDLDWRYRGGAFKPATIEYIAGEYGRILAFFTANPHSKLQDHWGGKTRRKLFGRAPLEVN